MTTRCVLGTRTAKTVEKPPPLSFQPLSAAPASKIVVPPTAVTYGLEAGNVGENAVCARDQQQRNNQDWGTSKHTHEQGGKKSGGKAVSVSTVTWRERTSTAQETSAPRPFVARGCQHGHANSPHLLKFGVGTVHL